MPTCFDAEVDALERRSGAGGPRDNLLLFYGSSSFTLWSDIDRYFPGYTIANHGFGGSTLEDCVEYFDRMVAAFSPRVIVLYAGDNDLANGATPEAVLAHLDAFIARKRQTLGAVPVGFVSIKVSPARFNIMHRIGYTNLIIGRRVCDESDVSYIDITRWMTARGLEAFQGYYAGDPLHMNREGYRVLAKSITEYLQGLTAPDIALQQKVTARPAWTEADGEG